MNLNYLPMNEQRPTDEPILEADHIRLHQKNLQFRKLQPRKPSEAILKNKNKDKTMLFL